MTPGDAESVLEIYQAALDGGDASFETAAECGGRALVIGSGAASAAALLNGVATDVIVSMLGPRPDEQLLHRVTSTFAAHIDALTGFDTHRRYPGRVLLLICTGESDLSDRERAVHRWRELASDLRTGTVAADHFRVFDPEHMPELAPQILEFLGVGAAGPDGAS